MKKKVFVIFVLILMLIQSFVLIPFGTVFGHEGVRKKEDITVTIKARPFDQFELVVPPIENLEKVVVGEGAVQARLAFAMPVQVIDIRGEHDGWKLSVSATRLESDKSTLPKGTLSLEPLKEIKPLSENAVLPQKVLVHNTVIDDGDVLVAKADEGEGMGSFELDFGEKPLVLDLKPQHVESGKYETEITWTLESGSGEKRILKQNLIELEIEKTKNASGMVRDGEGKGNRTNEKSGDVTNGISGDAAKGKDVNKDGVGSSVTSDKSDERKNDVRKKEGSNEGGLKLPQTATPYFNFMLFGLLVLLIGIIFYYINKKMLEKRLEEDE